MSSRQALDGHCLAIASTHRNLPNGVPHTAKAEIQNRTSHFSKAQAERNLRWLHSLTAIEYKKAKRIEEARRGRPQEWRPAIRAATANLKPSTLTRLAYRWRKGVAGWVKSLVGKLKDNYKVSELIDDDSDDDDDDEPSDDKHEGVIWHCSGVH